MCIYGTHSKMELIIIENSNQPIYQQIIDQIKNQIINKELKVGDPLPSIRGLAKSLKTSVITVKRAYLELSKDNFIETITGKGTFVKSVNDSFLNDEKKELIQKKLDEAIKTAKELNISKAELIQFLEMAYDNNEKKH